MSPTKWKAPHSASQAVSTAAGRNKGVGPGGRRYADESELAATAIAVIDLDGHYRDANRRLCSLLGATPLCLIGRRTEEFLPELDGQPTELRLGEVLARGSSVASGEGTVRRIDGSTSPAAVTAAVIRDDAGTAQYFFVQVEDISDRHRIQRALWDAEQEVRRMLDDLVGSVSSAVEVRDPYTAGHQRHVAAIAVGVGQELGLDNDALTGIGIAATIHDIGKLAVPAEILAKPGRLSGAEYELVKMHPTTGHELIAAVNFPWPVARMVLEHHERLDGSGYPAGLAGDDILLGSRIVGVADVVEAVSAHRPYRPGLGIETAMSVIGDGRGVQFDPDVVDALRSCVDRCKGVLPQPS